jgi:allantoin racemase
MRLLLVNGNTTQAVTDRVVAEARRCGAPGTEFTGATARFGVGIVSTEAENDVAAHAVLDVLSKSYVGHDAAILAISFDTALIGARQIVPIPVIGMTEAALHTACILGRRFGLICFGTRSRWMYLDLVRRSGLLERMVALETVEPTTTAEYLREGAQDPLVSEAAARLVSAGADVVVVTGAAVAGIAHRLAPQVSVPMVDGIGCAVGQAECLVRLSLRRRTPASRHAAERELSGVSPELASGLARI